MSTCPRRAYPSLKKNLVSEIVSNNRQTHEPRTLQTLHAHGLCLHRLLLRSPFCSERITGWEHRCQSKSGAFQGGIMKDLTFQTPSHKSLSSHSCRETEVKNSKVHAALITELFYSVTLRPWGKLRSLQVCLVLASVLSHPHQIKKTSFISSQFVLLETWGMVLMWEMWLAWKFIFSCQILGLILQIYYQ